MIRPAISKLASDVAALLGESLLPECATPECPFPDLEDRVRILAPGFLTELLLASDVSLVADVADVIPGEPEIDFSGTVSLDCPDDFLRLLCLKMSDWQRPVVNLTDYSGQDSFRVWSPREGIRGNPERPVALTGFSAAGKRLLKMYSSGEDARVETALYIAKPAIDSDGNMKIPDALYHPLVIKLKEFIGS